MLAVPWSWQAGLTGVAFSGHDVSTCEGQPVERMQLMTPAQLTDIDNHILAGHILLAIKSICEFAGVGVKDAIDIHFDRYQQLRLARPADFKVTHEEYFRDVYS